MAKNHRGLRRQRDAKRFGSLYKKKFRWVDFCIYCGQPKQCLDHVLPLSIASQIDFDNPVTKKVLGQGMNIVPSCHQCNRIAAANPFFNIREKRAFIQKRLREKLSVWLRHVIWEEDEIEELDRSMQDQVRQAMHNRDVSELRVHWPISARWHITENETM